MVISLAKITKIRLLRRMQTGQVVPSLGQDGGYQKRIHALKITKTAPTIMAKPTGKFRTFKSSDVATRLRGFELSFLSIDQCSLTYMPASRSTCPVYDFFAL